VNAHRALIAIIDDEVAVRRALARLLDAAGYRVEQFAGGGEFLASLRDHVPDCLVLDLHMPGMDGFAVLQAIGQLRPRLPVVVITGHDTPEARQRVAATACCACLRKPIDSSLLIDTMTEAMAPKTHPPSITGLDT
jgi:FixJ family two-component response regulator